MRIPLNLLSTQLREDWVDVPASLEDRSLGVGRVKLQEVPGDVFEELWSKLIRAEEEVARLKEAKADESKIAKAKAEKKATYYAVVKACVVDHDANTFESLVPQVEPSSKAGIQVLAFLAGLGYSHEEGLRALSLGKATKPFKAEGKGASEDMALFYDRCQPDGRFLITLLRVIKRFQDCDLLTAEMLWDRVGAPPFSPKEEASP